MKIAIINENSQVTKNKIIYDALKPIADKKDMKYIIMEWKIQMKRI